ncbi:predicted protein [Nematostella vectensis]|uniref:Uncharacterized protein n=1 Tax=Nematostella vectensis TaxID=45351 RepID=A7RI46_NEMVE|nr:predicted protein [Nematostella vectensis]|eukprot:XP_001641028.1 predicted protein [Nematostella vectensis]
MTLSNSRNSYSTVSSHLARKSEAENREQHFVIECESPMVIRPFFTHLFLGGRLANYGIICVYACSGAKRGRCPQTLHAADYCLRGKSTCNTDEDCPGPKKCCDQSCVTSCVLPVTDDRYTVSPSGSLSIKGVTSSDSGEYSLNVRQQLASGFMKIVQNQRFRVMSQSGKCPPQKENPRRKCGIGLMNQCTSDSHCGGKPCCFDGCRYKCKGRGDQQENPREGFCPFIRPPRACASDSDRCQHDWDCPEKKKCCSDSCRNLCVSPSPSGVPITLPGARVFQADEYFAPGERVTRVCQVSGEPFEGWYDPQGNKVTAQVDHVYVERRGPYHVLIIDGVTAEDGGKYTCRGSFDSAQVGINVNYTVLKVPPSVISLPPAGSVMLVQAAVTGHPSPQFVWYKGDIPISRTRSPNRYAVSPSGSLIIKDVKTSDAGTYTMRVNQDGRMYDSGIQVQITDKPGVSGTPKTYGIDVDCRKKEMVLAIDKKILEDVDIRWLRLRDPSCNATTNRTHVILRAPLIGCGTTTTYSNDVIVYSNAVQEEPAVGPILRTADIDIPFKCFYAAEGIASTLGLLPVKVPKFSLGTNSSTNFDLSMTIYRDENFFNPYNDATDYPLQLLINQPLFVEVKVDSSDTKLSVLAERCYATPTQNPNDPVAYDIINKGCKRDSTLQMYSSVGTSTRFSFRVFQFLQTPNKFLFIHCRVVVCNGTNPESRCAKGCVENDAIRERFRRQADDERAEFTQGPILVLGEHRIKARQGVHGGADKIPSQFLWIVIAMVAVCTACLVAMVYMMRKHSQAVKNRYELPHGTETDTPE